MDKGFLKQLERTREMMIQSGLKKGLLNAETIRLSKELDHLMNKYAKEAQYIEMNDRMMN
ncbi:aspartyl-phosphate phosphatase Spo0E family protein [Solibacillus sp. CAU 1738]|uniref:aspartyl-phosphate phosphatase Spo0E family protein n=1 Tax=Solibacillus sp. CAU 1738 TaxID=3140363 RepID=UPI0032602FD2